MPTRQEALAPMNSGGPPLFYRILNQLGITASDLERLR